MAAETAQSFSRQHSQRMGASIKRISGKTSTSWRLNKRAYVTVHLLGYRYSDLLYIFVCPAFISVVSRQRDMYWTHCSKEVKLGKEGKVMLYLVKKTWTYRRHNKRTYVTVHLLGYIYSDLLYISVCPSFTSVVFRQRHHTAHIAQGKRSWERRKESSCYISWRKVDILEA